MKVTTVIRALLLLGLTIGAGADDIYSPGDAIEYKAERSPEKWEPGTVVRMAPGGTQVIVREKPTQFFPEGNQRAYALDEVRRRGGAVPGAARPATVDPAASAPAVNATAEAGLMSQEEILAYLQSHLGDQPFQHPAREKVLKDLGRKIMQRGVDFRYQAIGAFSNALGKFGAVSTITFPMAENYGPPAQADWYRGTWDILKVGATVEVTRNRRIYQQQEMAAKAGSLTIEGGGRYLWSSPSGTFDGRWRAATPQELAVSYKGGAGVVLQRGKSGTDWIVFKRDTEGQNGEGVLIAGLDPDARPTREYAWRR